MVDYYPLRSTNHKLPEPDPEEEQAVQEPEVQVVWNHYENGDAKTVAVTVSIRLPLTACRCPHCEAAEQFPIRSRIHHRMEG
jgi:hypothetical protein